ncbi:natural killer cell receptor 2B4 isoform X2 [Columba livia]|uniref:natural killer cell receptor 2B4 isoform X2 n=2 Tax=Columba livia TaxID=8932 RepID=UPI0031BB4BBA
MIPEAKGKHNSLINTSVFTSSIFLPVHCPSQARPSCPERPSQEHVAAGAHPSCRFESLQGFTMLTWLQATITGYLLLVLEGSFAVKELTERRVAAEGSSVLMDAPDIKNVKLTEWEYIRNTTSELILQYYANSQSPTIYPAYQSKLIFFKENGSILLQRLQETDSGIYKATVDLKQGEARTTFLEVIKPVPQPELQCRSNLAGLPIELVCMVPEGMVASITWKKEGQPLPPEKCSLLSGNTTVLQIRSGEKSDCGSYSCNVSNVISWKEAALNLTVTGLTPNLHHVQRLAIVALMLVTFSAISFIFVLCQLMELRFGKEAWKHIILFTYGLLCISSLLLFATSIIWMQEEGLSVTFILLGMFFFTAVIGTAQAAAAVVWKPAALSRFKMKMWHCVIRNSIAPTTLIVNLLFTTLLLHNIQQLHERGCSEAVDLMTSCVFAAAAVVTALLLLFLCYHGKKRKEQMMRSHHTNRSTRVRATMVMEEIHGQRG